MTAGDTAKGPVTRTGPRADAVGMDDHERQVAAADHPLGCRFPSDYRAFLPEHDGLEHDGGGAFVVLYPLADVVEWRLDRRGWLPNVVQVWGYGADEALVYDMTGHDSPLWLISAIASDRDEAVWQADSFSAFKAHMRAGGELRFEATLGEASASPSVEHSTGRCSPHDPSLPEALTWAR